MLVLVVIEFCSPHIQEQLAVGACWDAFAYLHQLGKTGGRPPTRNVNRKEMRYSWCPAAEFVQVWFPLWWVLDAQLATVRRVVASKLALLRCEIEVKLDGFSFPIPLPHHSCKGDGTIMEGLPGWSVPLRTSPLPVGGVRLDFDESLVKLDGKIDTNLCGEAHRDQRDWTQEPGNDFPVQRYIESNIEYDFPVLGDPTSLWQPTAESSNPIAAPGAMLIQRCVFIVANVAYGGKTNQLAVREVGPNGSVKWAFYPCTNVRGSKNVPPHTQSPFFEQFHKTTYRFVNPVTNEATDLNWGFQLSRLAFRTFRDLAIAPPKDPLVCTSMAVGALVDGTHPVSSYVSDGVVKYDGPLYLNTWGGYRFLRSPDPAPNSDLLDTLLALLYVDICNCDLPAFKVIVYFCAHLLQRPGVPIHRMLVLYSGLQGVGKNNFLNSFGELIIGDPHYARLRVNEMVGRFNSACEGKTLVHCDEFNSDSAAERQRVKDLVTDTLLKVEEKFKNAREWPAIASYIVSCNELLRLEANDRRTYVIHCTDRFRDFPRDAYTRYHALGAEVFRTGMPLFAAWLMTLQLDFSGMRGDYLPSQAWDMMRENNLPEPIRDFITDARAGYTMEGSAYDDDGKWAVSIPSGPFSAKYSQSSSKARAMFQQLGVCRSGDHYHLLSLDATKSRIKNLLPLWSSVEREDLGYTPVLHEDLDELVLQVKQDAASLYSLEAPVLSPISYHVTSRPRAHKRRARVVHDPDDETNFADAFHVSPTHPPSAMETSFASLAQ